MKYPPTKNYDEKGFAPPLEPGQYKIDVAEVRETDKDDAEYLDKNGNHYCLVVFDVRGWSGNKLFDRFYFDPNYKHYAVNMGRFKQLLLALGMSTDLGGDTEALKGKTCMANVKIKVHKGNPLNNIAEFLPVDPNAAPDPDDSLPF